MLLKRDKSGPRDGYFLRMQDALKRAGITQPTLVVDKGRLDRNIGQLQQDLPAGMSLRLVAKSLASLPLLTLASGALETDRFMTFNAPMLDELADRFPKAEQLLGKPFSCASVAQFYAQRQGGAPQGRVCWLIDTVERLTAYDALAKGRGLSLDVALELDVGLHRGGFTAGPELGAALALIENSPRLTLRGVMGYEAHVSKLPATFGLRDKALAKAWRIYTAALEQMRGVFGDDHVRRMIRNAAGSPTFRLYPDTAIANEVSVGSALLKPADFDIDLLEAYSPALFIAAPALKVLGPMQTPVLEPLDRLKNLLDSNLATRVFIHGGYWNAAPVDPPGLGYNATYGRSSNQELLTGGARTDLAADDFVFLRPSQSEAILLQFGDIAVFEEGTITGQWAPMEISA